MARTPGSNTIAYYPLTSSTTTSDMKTSGTKYNLTNSSASFGTYQGVSCAYFNGSAYLYNTSLSFSSNPTQTVSIWFYVSSTSSSVYQTIYTIGHSSRTGMLGTWFKYGTGLSLSSWYAGYEVVKSGNINGQWHLLTNVTSGSSSKQYLDGKLYQTYTNSLSSAQSYIGLGVPYNFNTSDRLTGYLSECIVENKARTETEIQNYFNDTAWKYGLAPKPTIFYGSSPIKEIYLGTGENPSAEILTAIQNSDSTKLSQICSDASKLKILLSDTNCTNAFIAKNTLLQSYVSTMWNTVTANSSDFTLVANTYGDDSWSSLVTNAATANSITFFSGGYYSSTSTYGWMKHRTGAVAKIGNKGGQRPQSVTASNVEGVSFVGATFGQCGSSTDTTVSGDGYVAAATYKINGTIPTGGAKKITAVYYGSAKIRPKQSDVYYINLANSSTSAVTSAGFSYYGSINFDTNGAYSEEGGIYKNIDISSKEYVKFEFSVYTRTGDWYGSQRIGMKGTASYSPSTQYLERLETNKSYGRPLIDFGKDSTVASTGGVPSTGWYECSFEVNLKTGYTVAKAGSNTVTYTASASQLSDIKNMRYLDFGTSGTDHRLGWIRLTIT